MRDGLLLCELNAHTTWSDGELRLPELVDLYGRSGFDVLCVTDHAAGSSSPPSPSNGGSGCRSQLEPGSVTSL